MWHHNVEFREPGMTRSEALTASMEDYLEAIFHIVAEKGAARAKDISKRLKVNHSSVTGALQALASRNLVRYAPYEVTTLTPKGKALAEDVIRRHEILRTFFVKVLAVNLDGLTGRMKGVMETLKLMAGPASSHS